MLDCHSPYCQLTVRAVYTMMVFKEFNIAYVHLSQIHRGIESCFCWSYDNLFGGEHRKRLSALASIKICDCGMCKQRLLFSLSSVFGILGCEPLFGSRLQNSFRVHQVRSMGIGTWPFSWTVQVKKQKYCNHKARGRPASWSDSFRGDAVKQSRYVSWFHCLKTSSVCYSTDWPLNSWQPIQ